MRWLVFVLLLLNFASFLWFWRDSNPQPEPEAGQMQRESEFPVASLQLLDERDPSSVTDAELLSSEQVRQDQSEQLAVAEPEGVECFQIDGFTDAKQAEDFVAAYAENFTLSVSSEEVATDPAYRVYLAPAENRSAADTALRDLRARLQAESLNIDSFIISEGELMNAISLGLFSEHSNALNVERQMLTLGYQVVLAEQSRQLQRNRVFLAERPGNPALAGLWAQISSSYPQLQRTEKLCETIAHEF
ncbi:MAG: SPOR domain-containing protein [Pseudomonadales bacterium]|nr:SPOR domain-containing protein [Pseudomonadales bacterium]